MALKSNSSVDWEVVKAELEGIDDAWKQARFDSLPHVVEILTSQDPGEAIQILREQRDAIEDIVDDVVRGYHNGFNKAIHNYSQILRLFSGSAASISGLKENLAEAKRLLGSRNKQLQQLWYRSVTVRHIISLLDQIENVAKVSTRIEELIAMKRYYAAVQLHIQSVTMLEREGIQGSRALQDVRSDLSKLRGILFFKVVEELHLHLYNKGEYSENAAIMSDKDDDISNITIMSIPSSGNANPISRRTKSMRRSEQVSDGQYLSDGFHQPGSIDGGSSADGRDDETSLSGDMLDGASLGMNSKEYSADEFTIKESRHRRGFPSWLTDSTPNEFIDSMTKSDASLNVKYLQTMVECLALLGKIAAAGAIISQRLRPTIHEFITTEIKARAAAIEASRPRVDQVSKTAVVGFSLPKANGLETAFKKKLSLSSRGPKGMTVGSTVPVVGPGTPSIGPMGMGQASAQELLESILGSVTHILENHIVVGELMEGKSAIHEGPGSPRRATGDLPWNVDSDIARATGGYSLSFALIVIQSECQQLICDILRTTPDAATADAAVQTARLASKLPTKESSNGASTEEGLSFAFRFTDTVLSIPGGDGLRQARNKRNTAVAQEGYGTGAVLSERGIYLTPCVYRPVLQFTDKVISLLPQKYAQLGNDGLQSFMENFVKDQFLPLVRVDYRNRVQDSLASPAAFRPKSHAGIAYEAAVEKGRPVLQGPLAAGSLANEVVGWAQAMPKYAGDFIDVAQALLERTLERCRAAYTEAVLGSLSSSVVGRTDVENLMKQEPASSLLEVSYLAQCEKSVSVDQPLDADGLEAEMEMNNLLLSLRPVKQEQLIGDGHKLVLLAALSDSLEYLAESIEKLGHNASPSSPTRKKKVQQHIHHHRRTSSALTTSLTILADKYHSLSAECLRTLRVEMQLEALYHLQGMADRVYLTDQDAEEPEDFILSLTIQITRMDEEMTPYISPLKRNYIFGGICGVAATSFIKALHDMSSVNLFGVRQICRNCIALEQALAAVSSNNEIVCQRLDRVRTFYELLNLPFEALIAFVAEHDDLFSFSEYSSLLKVDVPDRDVPPDAVQRVGKILAPAA
eukprot:c28576_g1_i2 orf=370-3636(+)